MNKSKVRCWQFEDWHKHGICDKIYVTYPEDNAGFDLISCLHCGHIYSASVAKQVYGDQPLVEKVKNINCIECGNKLSETYHSYPDKYLARGVVHTFERPTEIPSDDSSSILEFDEIY